MFERNKTFSSLRHVIEVHRAGAFDLPAEVIDSFVTAERLDAERRSPRPRRLKEARNAVFESMLDAASAGGPFPEPLSLADAVAYDQAVAVFEDLLDRATTAAQSAFVELVTDRVDELVVKFLRPAFDQALDDARAAVSALDGVPFAAEALLSAPKAARDAYVRLEEIADRVQVVRAARRALMVLDPPAEDERDTFGELRNLPDVHPAFRKLGAPPWPTGRREYLRWLVTSDAEPWLPTKAEQVARYRQYNADAIAARQNGRMPSPRDARLAGRGDRG